METMMNAIRVLKSRIWALTTISIVWAPGLLAADRMQPGAIDSTVRGSTVVVRPNADVMKLSQALLNATPSQTQPDAQPLSLEAAVRIALDSNPERRAAVEGINAAREAVGEARAPFYPDLGLTAGYSRWQRHAFLPEGVVRPGTSSVIGPVNDWSAGLVSRYTLFDFGQRRAELGISKAREKTAEHDAERVRQNIIFDVHQAYFGLVAAMEMETAIRGALSRAEEHLRIANTRKLAGAVPQADVVRAQVEVANARLDLTSAQALVEASRGRLNTTMGLRVDTPLKVEAKAGDILRPETIDLSQTLRHAIEARPEVRAAEQQLVAAERGINAARSAYGPRIRAEAGFGWRDENLFPNDKDWRVGASIDLPIFTGFSRKHRLARARADAAREKAELDRARQSVSQEVWAAYWKLKESFEAVRSTEALARDAQEALRLTGERYNVGAGTINDLLDSESSFARAEATRVRSVWEYQIAKSALDRAAGRLAVAP